MVELRLTVDDGAASESLWRWLSQDSELRRHLRRETRSTDSGTMSPTVDTVVEGLVTGTIGGVIAYLGQALANWHAGRRQRGERRTSITVAVTGSGRQVDISTDDPEASVELLRVAVAHADEQTPRRTPAEAE